MSKIINLSKHGLLIGASCLLALDSSYATSKNLDKFALATAEWTSTSARLAFYAQDLIQGIVTDEAGLPIVGATVSIQGKTIGESTDASGRFTIKASKGDMLVVTSVGYVRQHIQVVGGAVKVILKSNAENLDEVVVVGYGKQNKSLVTGAVSQIGGEALQNRSISRVSQALQGQLPGLNIQTGTGGGAPGATQSINVRGFTGLGTTASPLIVIDGIQGGDINTINADDIESISVLKDAASSAIYGSSAPYGVILITTKQGKKGAKPVISYNNNLSWAEPINLPKMMNSLDFATLYNEAAKNGGRSPIFSEDALGRIKSYLDGSLKTETIASTLPGANEYLAWGESNANNDWFKVYFKDLSFSQQHNVNVSGGSDHTKYFIGLGYNDRNGMYKFGSDDYKRFNVRTNITTIISKMLDFSLRGSFSKELEDGPNTYSGKTGGNYMHQIARKWPTVALFNPDGNYSDPSDVLLHKDGGRRRTTVDKALLTGEFVFRLAPGWTATTNYTFDGTFQDLNSHTKTLFTVRPDGSQAQIGGTFPNGFSRSNYRVEHHIINAFTKYDKQVDDHFFSVMGGYVRDLNSYQYYAASNNQLYSDNVPALSLTYGVAATVSDQVRRLASDGFFGRFNYNYKEKYVFEFNGRYDGTSRFLSDVRWKFYPGVSVGWNVDKEAFFEAVKPVVSTFKLRASYGSLGDQGFLDTPDSPQWYPFYPSLQTTRPTSSNWLFGGNQQATVAPPGLIYPDLTWVTTTSLNMGAEVNFFQNKLTTTFDWYIRKADDFAGPAEALPGLLGATPPRKNNAGMETRGMELSIGWRDKVGEVSYGVRANLSDYKGKVTRYPNPAGLTNTWYEGQVMNDIWGYETYGLFQSAEEVAAAPKQVKISGETWTPGDVRYVDLNGNGEIDFGTGTLSNPGDRRVIGNSTPRYAYGFTGDAAYKGFDLSFFIQGIAKRDAWIGSNYFWGIVGDEWQSSPFDVHQDRWSAENPDGYFPKFYLTGQNGKNTVAQTRYLQNASYLRLKNLQVGYSLPKQMLERIGFGKVRFYVSIDNVFTITDLIKTMDPELSISDSKIYPLQRTYAAGVNFSF
ncbi:SusC/RagA family TonB-linked outer membrane protein [Sphingobacterium psychroaquaticum]|uniref:TonB-linked outer membrane protein, SusC/RagA family n=1 Tax=Sphingobacterium psychroaquaticum TaxID=561061 RepID=A0A1X7J0W7_9SPHI|nr:TonB-dependent receptor [Sphingobacterium psychroaquaticum]SMG21122.1 TonB-linked outer membrane protein, SusC/RagA family [Sphingobacterium psychroaquaticum]